MLTIWREHGQGTRYWKHVERVLHYLNEIYDVLDFKNADGVHPFFLPPPEVARFRLSIDRFLAFYSSLTRSAKSQQVFRWNLTPKFHQLWHMGLEAELLNPRMVWNYCCEDWVGRISTIGVSSRYSQVAARRSKAVCEKWCMGQSLRMFHKLLDLQE